MNSELKRKPGLWIGIDLGTTNSTAAFYDRKSSEAKLVRFRPSLSKDGKILPSTVSFLDGKVVGVGQEAIDAAAVANEESSSISSNNRVQLVSSVKRIWGLDVDQFKREMEMDPNFLKSCPFKTIVTKSKNDVREYIDIVVQDEGTCITVSPIKIVETLLRTIREEADAYFHRSKEGIAIGTYNPAEDSWVRHCIITVPAHFSNRRRECIVESARNVGFDGYVGTLIESTAATISYGLFVGRTKKKNILVFDMGGGTTDCTVAEMIPMTYMNQNLDSEDHEHLDQSSFRVLGTKGDPKLGGDNMDELLFNHIQHQFDMMLLGSSAMHDQSDNLKTMTIRNHLRMSCRDLKEELCGGNNAEDDDLSYPESAQLVIPASATAIIPKDTKIYITQSDFKDIIAPIVTKASSLVTETLNQCNLTSCDIDEVILVGGSTKTPSIRSMLQDQFSKSELCTSIDPYSAVAQGAAVYGAIVSDLVPKYELRNAMMLDALPHPIGVMVLDENGEEDYVPILKRGMTLPAMNCATFQLHDIYQKGVSITAVEDVGDEYPLERIGGGDGTFTFLLHRLSDEQITEMELSNQKRCIEVGMTVETNGKFIVSIFDKNDPEHLEKKRRYQEWKRSQMLDVADLEEEDAVHPLDSLSKIEVNKLSIEEILLLIGVVVIFLLYVAIKVTFVQHLEDFVDL